MRQRLAKTHTIIVRESFLKPLDPNMKVWSKRKMKLSDLERYAAFNFEMRGGKITIQLQNKELIIDILDFYTLTEKQFNKRLVEKFGFKE